MGTLEFALILILSVFSSLVMTLLAIHIFSLKATTTIFGGLLTAIAIWSFAVGESLLGLPPEQSIDWFLVHSAALMNQEQHLGFLRSLNQEELSVDILINRADHAMYHAKRNGRDQVKVWDKDITLV